MAEHPETTSTTFRFIDFLSLPRDSGECVVLLLTRPGQNLLGQYFPPLRVNELLLAEASKAKSTSSPTDTYMRASMELDVDDGLEMEEDHERFDVMDLATLLEYVVCLRFSSLR